MTGFLIGEDVAHRQTAGFAEQVARRAEVPRRRGRRRRSRRLGGPVLGGIRAALGDEFV
jgi:hypothetical protein